MIRNYLRGPVRTWMGFTIGTVQRTWTDPVPMAAQLLDHSEPEYRPLDGMMQHMQADQPRVQVAIIHSRVTWHQLKAII